MKYRVIYNRDLTKVGTIVEMDPAEAGEEVLTGRLALLTGDDEVLPAGEVMAYNATGRPEPVMTNVTQPTRAARRDEPPATTE